MENSTSNFSYDHLFISISTLQRVPPIHRTRPACSVRMQPVDPALTRGNQIRPTKLTQPLYAILARRSWKTSPLLSK